MKNGLIIDDGGNKVWYRNDLFHNENGPAVERNDGTKFWYINGINHREDGPAIEFVDGNKEWWINGLIFTEEDFNRIILERKLNNELPVNNIITKKVKL